MNGHLGSLAGAVDGEEAQAGRVQAEKVMPRVAEQLAGLLRRRVGRDRLVDIVRLAERHGLSIAVDRRRRREDEVLHPVEAAALEQVGRALDVDLLVQRRALDGGPHTGPGRQMDHALGAKSGENRLQEGCVEDVAPHQLEVRVRFRAFEVARLEPGVIEVVEVVQPEDLVAGGEQAVGEIRTDEAGGAGDENAHEIETRRVLGSVQSRSAAFDPSMKHTPPSG
jgi:hypothetical protein